MADETNSSPVHNLVSLNDALKNKKERESLEKADRVYFTINTLGSVADLDELDQLIADIASQGVTIDVVMISGQPFEYEEKVIIANDL